MHPELQQVFHLPITLREVLANIAVASCCGIVLAIFYNRTHRSINYSFNLVKSIIMLATITAFVVMVIGDNLARAFGMVALISLIRFRTTIKGAQDFMFIYLALAIGLSAGVGLYAVTLVGTALVIAITWATMQFGPKEQRNDFLLRVTSESGEQTTHRYRIALDKFCKIHRQITNKTELVQKAVLIKSAYYIVLRNRADEHLLIDEMQGPGTIAVSLEFTEI